MDKLNGTDANGTVEVGFWVDTSGAVGQVTALWPSGTALDNPAIDIVQNQSLLETCHNGRYSCT